MFSQILKLVPRIEFERMVKQTGAEYASKGFSSWSQFVAMLFCQLGRAHSLREIEGGLKSCEGKLAHLGIEAPARASLAYANAHRPWQLFEQVFYGLYEKVAGAVRAPRKFRFKHKLVSLDSTVIDLCLSIYDWARFRRTKGAVKLHLVLDHDGYLPCFGLITEGSVHDVKVAQQLHFAPGTVVVDDRAYNDYRLFASWTEAGVFFVTRMKDNAQFRVIEERQPPQNRGILCDQTIELSGVGAQTKCPHRLRRIEAVREDTGEILVFLTNHHQLGASTVAAVYKERWQVDAYGGTVLQGAQAEPEDQDLRRHHRQRGKDPDLERADLDAPAALSAARFALRLEHGESGGAAAHEPLHASRSAHLARRAVRRSTRSHRASSEQLRLRLMLDSTRGLNHEILA